jgi:hypothetical protein
VVEACSHTIQAEGVTSELIFTNLTDGLDRLRNLMAVNACEGDALSTRGQV